jgi:hypothetical protein
MSLFNRNVQSLLVTNLIAVYIISSIFSENYVTNVASLVRKKIKILKFTINYVKIFAEYR